ncbi:MAG: hypothetical protein EA404_15470 [Spirochaetaceae bacterium]|nr:MAG: hypothetical protein EA404_15470 [Spirochaetaceae bacterium]
MNARFVGFGTLEIDGQRFSEDVVVRGGSIEPRRKEASRALKARYGHTPLSEHEPIPWQCATLIVGTGADGRLPITDTFRSIAAERGVKIVAVPTEKACQLLNSADLSTTNAILHLTC